MKYYVVLPWEEYNSLNPAPLARVFTLHGEAAAYAATPQDEVLTFDSEALAYAAKAAYNEMAAADWQPNQSASDRADNSLASELTSELLAWLRKHQAE